MQKHGREDEDQMITKQIEKVATGNGPIMWVVFDRWENGRRINAERFWTEAEARGAAA